MTLDADCRSHIQSMESTDAIEYLLGVVEQLQDIKAEKLVDAGWEIPLTRTERRIVTALINRIGTLSKDALYSAAYFDTHNADDLPCIKVIDVFVCSARKKIPAAIGKIKTVWGEGYSFQAAQ